MSNQINDSEDFLARWLGGDLTPEEQKSFEESEDFGEFNAIVNFADKLLIPPYDVDAEFNALKTKQGQSHQGTKVISFRPLFRYAAAAVLVIGISLIFFLKRPNYVTVETLAGQTKTIALPDSSIVVINASSSLRYNRDDFAGNRILDLDGEAFFEVRKGVNFEVVTNQGTVKVLGT